MRERGRGAVEMKPATDIQIVDAFGEGLDLKPGTVEDGGTWSAWTADLKQYQIMLWRIAFWAALACLPAFAATDILMVADEIPAMEVLAKQLKARAGVSCEITTQDKMPAGLAAYQAVMVYIHKSIGAPAEEAFIAYAKGGGKLFLLHHSISSGKRENRDWFPISGYFAAEPALLGGRV